MKKNFKKVTAILAATAMMSTLMTGCGNDPVESAVSSDPAVSTETANTNTESQVAAEEFSYPMEGGRTITYAKKIADAVKTNGYASDGETKYAKAMEEATGIHVEYSHNSGKETEWFNVLMADGEYTDIMEFQWNTVYPGGLVAAAEDGVIIPLNDVIDQYMPNFKAWLEENPDLAKMLRTDDGIYYGIPSVTSSDNMGGSHGVYIRQDMLEEMGETVPETIDEWHDLLVKVKETYNISPIVSTKNILSNGAFLNAYAPSGKYTFNVETGEIEYKASTEGYKAFVTTMAQWYAEGLIDKDFVTLDNATVKSKLLNNEGFCAWGYAGSGLQTIMQEGLKTNPDFTLAAVAAPALEKGGEVLFNSAAERFAAYYGVISTQCKDVEAAARYLDFLWSEEGIKISNFGVEGVSYTMVDGIPTYTDEILNNPEGKTVAVAMGDHIRAYGAFPGIQDYYYQQGYYVLPTAKEAMKTWGGIGTNKYTVTSMLTYTTEEAERMGVITSELDKYVSEMLVKFVIGTEDIESGWDKYLETLEKYNMAEAVAITKAAYERMMAR